MDSFSQRMGLARNAELLQISDADQALRISIWNCFYACVERRQDKLSVELCRQLYYNVIGKPIDSVPLREWDRRAAVRSFLDSCEWNKVYDFIEVAYRLIKSSANHQVGFSNAINHALQKEASGYRLVNGEIAKITSELEIREIHNARAGAGFDGPREHISRAAQLLFDRVNPDPRNSIKESISAIEAIAKVIVGDENATLGAALKEIETAHQIHPALREAFSKLYGYTSDQGGIRHGMIDQSEVDEPEAKFMLIACSAFLNYLIEMQAHR